MSQSISKSLALAAATLTVSTWALGTLWMSASTSEMAATPAVAVVASAP